MPMVRKGVALSDAFTDEEPSTGRGDQNEKDLNQSGLLMMVPIIGFELMTYRLQGGCSTN
jgi:hypothetical protein